MVRRDEMSPEPLHEGDYTDRQVEAARRVLVDVAQVLASFRDAMVVVGGWVPDLPFPPRIPGTSEASTSIWRSTPSSSATVGMPNF